jgi:hypothetical protein
MLIFHKFVDVLRGASHEIELEIIDGVFPSHIDEICRDLIDSEKFDFGSLPLEPVPDDPLRFAAPRVTLVEWEAWCDGLVPLPAPVSWFEFTVGNSRSGLLVREIDREWAVTRLDWADVLFYDSHAVWISKDTIGQKLMADGALRAIPARITGPATLGRAVISASQRERSEMWGASGQLAVYLALMLISSSTEIRIERAPDKLNKSRIARGRMPLAAHRIVRIVPEAYLRVRRAEAGLRMPPSLHYRRSHRRTYHRGEPSQFSRLIPRCLVNPGADAEVSHEYRVIPPSGFRRRASMKRKSRIWDEVL